MSMSHRPIPGTRTDSVALERRKYPQPVRTWSPNYLRKSWEERVVTQAIKGSDELLIETVDN